MLVDIDEREEYVEVRWIGIGLLQSLVVMVVFTEPDGSAIRIVSLRKARSHERIRYEENI